MNIISNKSDRIFLTINIAILSAIMFFGAAEFDRKITEDKNTNYISFAAGTTTYKNAVVTDGNVEFTDASAPTTSIDDQSTTLTDGYYVVDSDVTIETRINVTGDVHIILADGFTLTANKGIGVTGAGNTLTIYGQSDVEDAMGKILVPIGVSECNAAIGGTNGLCEKITINGGKIEVTGGRSGAGIGGGYLGTGDVEINGGYIYSTGGRYASGIGGGGSSDTDSENATQVTLSTQNSLVTINGGYVKATGGQDGAGIGGGSNENGIIIINNGTIEATGGKSGAGIGGGWSGTGTITIDGGTITAKAGTYAAGIGGGEGGFGDVTINGGNITSYGGGESTNSNQSGGAGIGGGENGSGIIEINGGTITAKGGGENFETDEAGGSGIGGGNQGNGTITITDGTITAIGTKDSAGIGGGSSGDATVTISGGTIIATGGSDGAGIGGGWSGTGTITIDGTNTDITAKSTTNGAGIGGGETGDGEIIINSGTITAIGGGEITANSNGSQSGGAGIGGGEEGNGNITINGGTITAKGGGEVLEYDTDDMIKQAGGAGIGGGNHGYGHVTITAGDITAKGAKDSAGIGGGYQGEGTITITAGTIEAIGGQHGAGIGGGWTGDGTVTIEGGSVISTGGAAGIGGGEEGKGTVNISSGTVKATGMYDSAGIGGGVDGEGDVTITGGNIESTGGYIGASLGSGKDVTIELVTISEDLVYVTNPLEIPTTGFYPGIGTAINNFNNDKCIKIKSAYTPSVTYTSTDTSYINTTIVGNVATFPEESVSAKIIVDSPEPIFEEGWYVVNTDTTMTERIAIIGDVNIILADNCTLTANKGISVVNEEDTLTIYSQVGENGKIIVPTIIQSSDPGIAGIGGIGNVIINGGIITSRGNWSGAGIGGTAYREGNVIINNGTVTASGGSSAAAIGGGDKGNGNVTINRGTIEATGGGNAAGIGGGLNSDGNITINGGLIQSTGSKNSAGIGAGKNGSSTINIGRKILYATNPSAMPSECDIESDGTQLVDSLNDKFARVNGRVTFITPENIEGKVGISLGSLTADQMGLNSPFTYQWYSNSTNSNTGGVLLSGETSNTYDLPTLSIGTHYYYVTATDNIGTVASKVITVDVTKRDGLIAPMNMSVAYNEVNDNYKVEIVPVTNCEYKFEVDEMLRRDWSSDSNANIIMVDANAATIKGYIRKKEDETYKVGPQATAIGMTKCNLDILGGSNGAYGSGTYKAGQVVNINAGIKNGYTFKNWTTTSGGVFGNDTSKETTYTMPGNNSIINANWTKNPSSGTSSSGSPSGESYTGITVVTKEEPFMKGISNNTFKPKSNMTRAEAAAIFARLDKRYDEDTKYTVRFPDVSGWSSNYIGFCDKYGIMIGYKDGEFKRENVITKAEFTTALIRSSNIKEGTISRFKDVNNTWCEKYISALEKQVAVNGKPNGIFGATDPVTRAEAARLVNGVKNYTIADKELKEYNNIFIDVIETSWYYKDVVIATSARQ